MLIGGLDVETTGLSPKEDEITELGMVIWDSELDAPVWMESIFRKDCKKKISPQITELTGITRDLLDDYGRPDDYIQEKVTEFSNAVQFYMAHNAKFDRGFMDNKFKMVNKPWVCSVKDIEYPESFKTKSLGPLAAYHGFINPWPHRALTDVLTMFKVASNYNFHEILANARLPKVTLECKISYDQRHLPKEAGFYWDSGKKIWFKEMRKDKATELVKTLGFLVNIVDPTEEVPF